MLAYLRVHDKNVYTAQFYSQFNSLLLLRFECFMIISFSKNIFGLSKTFFQDVKELGICYSTATKAILKSYRYLNILYNHAILRLINIIKIK